MKVLTRKPNAKATADSSRLPRWLPKMEVIELILLAAAAVTNSSVIKKIKPLHSRRWSLTNSSVFAAVTHGFRGTTAEGFGLKEKVVFGAYTHEASALNHEASNS